MKEVLLVLLLLLPGCAFGPPPPARTPGQAPPPVPAVKSPDPVDRLAGRLQEQSRRLESEGRKRASLERLKVLAAVRHDDPSLAEGVRRLEEEMRLEAEEVYRRGLALHRRGEHEEARKAYVEALALDPGHEAALKELKNGLFGDGAVYRPRREGRLPAIARNVYGRAELAAVLAAVNDLDPARRVSPGSLVIIPRLDELLTAPPPADGEARQEAPKPPAYSAEAVPADVLLATARRLFNEREFREAVEEAEKIPAGGPLAAEAREVINGSYFHIGGLLADEGKLPSALEAYRRVDGDYRNVGETIAALETRMGELAEEHYIAGVKFFVSERLEQAISEWQKTLALRPGHEKAGEDIRKAQKLLKELQKVQETPETAP